MPIATPSWCKHPFGNPLGGDFYTIFNVEWDFPIKGALGGAVWIAQFNPHQESVEL